MSRILPDLSAAVLRFPVPTLIAILTTAYANLYPAQPGYHGWPWWGTDIFFPCLAGMLAACAAHYFARSRTFSAIAETVLALLAGVLAATLVYWERSFATSPLFLFLGLIALLPVSGSLRAGVTQMATWRFTLALAQAAFLAILTGLIISFALTSLAARIDFLSSFDLLLHYRAIVTSWLLVSPVAFLAFIPDGPDEDGEGTRWEVTMLGCALRLSVTYVLVPVVLLYAGVLHIYAFRLVFGGELPDGFIAWLFIVFVGAGAGIWLASWPWRASGSPLLRLFLRNWCWLTIIPLLLFSWVTWERLEAFGLTPDRYGLLVIAVWSAGAALYWIARRDNADMRLLLGGLAFLLLIGSFGPWGAKETSATSQAARLTDLLKAENVLTPEGRLTYTQPTRSAESSNRIGQILFALDRVDGIDRLKPLFHGRKDDPFATGANDWGLLDDIRARLKIAPSMREHDEVRFNSELPVTRDLDAKERLIGPVTVKIYPGVMPQGDAHAESDGRTLFVTVADRKWEIPLQPLLKKLKAATGPGREQAYVHEVDPDLRLIISQASGIIGAQQRGFSMGFWLILRQ